MDRFVNKPNLTDEQVLAYLSDHPKFFVNNSNILSLMEIPKRWQDDKVADMQSFLLDQRSHEIDELRDCAHEVIETSRSNLSVQTRTHAAILSLIGTSHLGQFIEVLNHRNCNAEKKRNIKNVLERTGLYDGVDDEVKMILR